MSTGNEQKETNEMEKGKSRRNGSKEEERE
jgi:hypothetical protein